VSRPALVRLLLDEDIRRGLDAVLQHGQRCVVCGGENDDMHDAQPHSFVPPDVFNLFLEAAQRHEDRMEARW
jgi:hypothetical protein